MDSSPFGRVALMSIRPAFSQRILSGSKRVEFRKRRLANDVTHVVIYETAPTMRIVGIAEVGHQVSASPHKLWSQYKSVAGIERAELLSYFSNCAEGVAIELGEVWQCESPVGLSSLSGVSRAPQSLQYLSRSDAHQLLALRESERAATSNRRPLRSALRRLAS